MYTLYTCSNIAELRTIRGNPEIPVGLVAATIMGQYYPLDEHYAVYAWDPFSTLSDNPPEVVRPTDWDTGLPWALPGRWHRVDIESMPQVNSDWNATTGVTAILNKPTLHAVATSGAYSDLTGKPALASVATSGAYADLTGKPTIPAAQVNTDWNSVGGVTQLLNKPTLSTVATSGSYTDLSNKPTIPTIVAPVQSTASRTLNTGFQVSTTRLAHVKYAVQQTITASISGGQNGDVILEIASDSGFTSNLQTIDINGFGQTYSLAVAIQGVQPQTTSVSGWVPIGYYVRIRTANNTGTPSYSIRAQQELLY